MDMTHPEIRVWFLTIALAAAGALIQLLWAIVTWFVVHELKGLKTADAELFRRINETDFAFHELVGEHHRNHNGNTRDPKR